MPLSIEDRIAIVDLAACYSQAWDYGDVDAWVQTFTDDGLITDGERCFSGVDELRAFAESNAKGPLRHRHWTNNHVLDGDGDTATHSSYIMIVAMDEQPVLAATGIYRDKLRKVRGEWRFERREVTKECPR